MVGHPWQISMDMATLIPQVHSTYISSSGPVSLQLYWSQPSVTESTRQGRVVSSGCKNNCQHPLSLPPHLYFKLHLCLYSIFTVRVRCYIALSVVNNVLYMYCNLTIILSLLWWRLHNKAVIMECCGHDSSKL